MRRRWRAVVLSGVVLGWGALAARRWADAPVEPQPWTPPAPARTTPVPLAPVATLAPPAHASPAPSPLAWASPAAPPPPHQQAALVQPPPEDADDDLRVEAEVVEPEELAPPAPQPVAVRRTPPTPEERVRALELLRRATEEGEAGIDTHNSSPLSEEEREAAEAVLSEPEGPEPEEGAPVAGQFVEPPEEDDATPEPAGPR